jgi:hypothetical protein
LDKLIALYDIFLGNFEFEENTDLGFLLLVLRKLVSQLDGGEGHSICVFINFEVLEHCRIAHDIEVILPLIWLLVVVIDVIEGILSIFKFLVDRVANLRDLDFGFSLTLTNLMNIWGSGRRLSERIVPVVAPDTHHDVEFEFFAWGDIRAILEVDVVNNLINGLGTCGEDSFAPVDLHIVDLRLEECGVIAPEERDGDLEVLLLAAESREALAQVEVRVRQALMEVSSALVVLLAILVTHLGVETAQVRVELAILVAGSGEFLTGLVEIGFTH